MSYDRRIPEATTEELQNAICKLKEGKSPDSNGIRAEDIKACDDETREMVRQIFNEIIKRNNFTPDEWKKVKIKVIHKKGDELFSTILFGKFFPMLDQKQAEDQAGFRKTYQTTDHLATYRWIEQKCHEWGIKMWTATGGNVDHEYVSLLRNIFRDQKASVQTDEESNIFDVQKGSKQGDPMSSLLFNTVLQYSLKEEIQRWQKRKGMGKNLSDHDRDCLTNLRFADDVMLFATSKEQIRRMMCDFKKATEVGDMSIENLTRNGSVNLLGQRISFYQQETIEIKSRIRAAWATFHKYRKELTSKNYMLKHRLRLFDATVSPDYLLRSGNKGSEQRTRKNDSIDTTQDATTHYPDKKEIQKD